MTKIIFPSSVNNHYQIVVQHNDNTFQIPTNLESIVLLLQNFCSTPFGDGYLICNNYFLTILLPSFRFKRTIYRENAKKRYYRITEFDIKIRMKIN